MLEKIIMKTAEILGEIIGVGIVVVVFLFVLFALCGQFFV